MDLKNFLRKLVPMRWQKPNANEPLSIVLLHRSPHSFSAEEVRLAAERAWGVRFVGDVGSKHFVMQAGFRLLIKAGPHLLVLFSVPKPHTSAAIPEKIWTGFHRRVNGGLGRNMLLGPRLTT